MNSPANNRFAGLLLCSVMLAAALLPSTQAGAQPSNRPLLTNQSGANPNLMVALDNSGSMAFTYHESYAINDEGNVEMRRCPAPFSNSASSVLNVFNAGLNGPAIYSHATGTYTCFQRNAVTGQTVVNTGVSVQYAPQAFVSNWDAQRSAAFNPVYYDPRVRYLPRVNGDGLARAPVDPNVVFVSNQNSTGFRYTVYENDNAPGNYRVYHSFYANGTTNFQGVANTLAPPNFTSRYNLNYTGTLRIPQHAGLPAANAAGQTFSYAYCPNPITSDPPSCRQLVRVNVAFGAAATYNIVAPHNRTDCAGNVCSNEQEVTNILNWYRWYSNRQLATSTAIGLALADVDDQGQLVTPSTFDDKLRIGYMPINDTTIPNLPFVAPGNTTAGNTNLAIVNPPGSPASNPAISRGVRLLDRGSPANTQLFDWLYNVLSRGGTPLHNSIERAADYYLMRNGVTENAWRTDPTGVLANDSEKSCRRSFNLLFSDGGWTGAPTAPSPAGPDFDNMLGPVIEKRNPITNALEDSLQYNPAGANTLAGRQKYTPFPSTGTGGLADITANYFWRVDMRPGPNTDPQKYNNIQTFAGQPAFWQNMATYTVGYQIRPTGNVSGIGLTFEQIDQYRTQYILSGYAAATKPAWPTGDLLVANSQTRVDDFIHAGYTGGARSFSAQTAGEVKSIFNTILAEVLGASGRDAGVSVSSGGDSSTLAGQLKYTVSYRTMDNSGNILSRALDAFGNETGVTAWSAEQLMPSADTRRVFTMHNTNQPVSFSGTFTGLPTDVQNALRQGPDAARIADDASFINYLRGDNTALDAQGALFRQRTSKIAAMVNPPSVLMGYARDYGYDETEGSGGGVDGFDSYAAYSGRKLGYPSSLFVATNAGVMHSFSGASGMEQAAFMPRRSLSRMLEFADEPYNFEYVLDGPITQNDIFNRRFATQNSLPVADQWRAWRHVGVGTGGRGEQLIYAVNSPIKPGAVPNRIPDMEDFLWETGPDLVNAADGGDVTLGYIANSARSGQTEDFADQTNRQRGKWIVAVNNGHYNGETNGEEAGLVVLDALTGDVVRTIPLPPGYSAGRGLSGVTLLRNYELNHRVVAAYAGDANGQLWRFNLTGEPSTWHVEHGAPLFTVPGNRPIFGHPSWHYHSQRGFMVVFATGIMLEEADLDDQGAQAIYGIWDRMDTNGVMVGGPFTEVQVSELQEQRIRPATATRVGSIDYYGITDAQIDWNTQRGWFMPMENVGEPDPALRPGERSIADVINIGKSVLITSTVLRRASNGEMCTVSDLPANYVYLLNAETASSARSRSFDVTGDGRLDPVAVAHIRSGGFSRGVSVSAFQSSSDGTPRAAGVVGAPPSASDPYVAPVIHTPSGTPTSDKLLGDDGNVGLDGEDKEGGDPTGGSRCKNMRAIIIGTETESLQGGVFCPPTNWSRTQFQLSAPPKN